MAPARKHTGALVAAMAGLLIAGPSFAAPPPRRLKIWRPAESILAIAQTPDRYLWFGTHAGLLRFDGVAFTSFDRSNTPELELDRVSALVVDRAGALWVGLNAGGVVVRRGKRWHRTKGVEGTDLSGLAMDGRGGLWAGTRKGLFHLDGQLWSRKGVPAALANAEIDLVRSTRDGGLWVQSTSGSGHLRPDGFVAAGGTESVQRSWASALIADLLAPDESAQARAIASSAPLVSIGCRTRGGELWLGGSSGVIVRGPSDVTRLNTSNGLPDDKVTALFEDHEGTVWIGTMAGGLVQLKRSVATGWPRQGGQVGDTTFSVIEAAGGEVWTTSPKGVHRSGDDGPIQVRMPAGVPDWSGRSLAATSDGAVSIATLGHGIVQVRDGKLRTFTTRDGLPSNDVAALLGARDGSLWGGAATGELVHLVGDRVERVPLGPTCTPASPGASCAQTAVTLLELKGGGLAAGTLDAGLVFFDHGRVRRLTEADGLPRGMITALHEDASGAVWVGLDGGGLARVSGRTVSSFAGVVGLPRRLYGLVEDAAGHLWMCSDRGVYRVSRAALEQVAASGAAPPPVARYGTEDGMPSEQCHRFQPVAWHGRDGRLLFATFQGVAQFTLDQRESLPPAPPAILERVVVDGQDLDEHAGIEVGPGPGALEVHYTAPTSVAVQRVRFRYRLDGFDRGWIDAGPRRSAYYTNLSPGRYRFVVEALRDENPGAATSAALAFRLRPRFRQTGWFRASVAAGAVVLLCAAYALRRQLLRARTALVAEERSRIALDLHDNLAQVFSALGFQIDSLHKLLRKLLPGDESAPARLRQLRETAAHARVAARNAIFNLRPEGQARRPLADALAELGRVYPDAAITVASEGMPRELPLVAENELLHIAQEATSNAIQHGRAGRVTLTLSFERARVGLWIRDDGGGFDPAQATGRGAGIPGMRERARRAGGDLFIESTSGRGSAVGVVITARRETGE